MASPPSCQAQPKHSLPVPSIPRHLASTHGYSSSPPCHLTSIHRTPTVGGRALRHLAEVGHTWVTRAAYFKGLPMPSAQTLLADSQNFSSCREAMTEGGTEAG